MVAAARSQELQKWLRLGWGRVLLMGTELALEARAETSASKPTPDATTKPASWATLLSPAERAHVHLLMRSSKLSKRSLTSIYF